MDEKNKPIFILGVPRSGTTLLSFILDSHPRIAVGRETSIMKGIKQVLSEAGTDVSAQLIRGWYLRYGYSRPEIISRIRAFVEGIFVDFARSQGKERWGEKSPRHVQDHELINEIFPESQFVHIVRDPRAVYASRKEWEGTLESFIKEWQEENMKLASFGEGMGPNRYYRLRYEDLVMEPEMEIRKVLDFLGEAWDPAVLEHEKIEPQKFIAASKDLPIHQVHTKVYEGKAVVEGGPRNDPSRAIDKKSIDKWKVRLRKLEIARIQNIAERGMNRFGYEIATGLIPLIGKLKFKPVPAGVWR